MQRLWSADELGEHWTLLPEDLALLTDLPDTGKLGLATQLAFWRPRPLSRRRGGYCPSGRRAPRRPDRRRRRRPRRLRLGGPHRAPAPPVIVDHLAVAEFDDGPRPVPPLAGGRLLPASRRRRRWKTRSPAGSRASGSRDLAPTASTASCARPAPRMTTQRCSAWPTALTPARASAWTRCWPTTARAPRLPGLPPIPAGSGWRACWPRSASSSCCAAWRCRRDLLRGLHPDQVKRFRRRAAVESAWELRRHPERIRLPLLAFWCVPREAEVVDGLVELLIQDHAPDHGEGRAPRRRGTGRGSARGARQGRHPVQGGRGRGRQRPKAWCAR